MNISQFISVKISLFIILSLSLHQIEASNRQVVDSLKNALNYTLSTKERIETLNELAWELQTQAPEEGLQYAKEARSLAEKYTYPAEIALSLTRMGTIELNRLNYKNARKYLEEALVLERDVDHSYGIARASALLCTVYGALGYSDKAVPACQESISLFKSLDMTALAAASYQRLFIIYRDIGNAELALNALQDKMALSETHNDTHIKLNTLDALGAFYQDIENHELAIKTYQKAIDEWTQIGDSAKLGGIYNKIGTAYYNMDKLHLSKAFYHLALAYKQRFNPENTLAETYQNIGLIYTDQKHYDSAAYYYRKSLAINEQTGDVDALSRTYYNLGNNYKDMERYDSALIYYKKAEELSPNATLLRETYHNLSDVYFHFGLYDSANLYRNKHIDIRDSLDAIAREAIRLRDNYQREQQKTASMQADLQLKEAEILQQNMTTTILIISLLLLAVIFFAILKYYQQRKRAQIAAKDAEINRQKVDQLLKTVENKEMSAILRGQESERKRIAQDLHDRLGSMLAMVKIHFKSVEDNLETIKEDNKRQYQKANTLLDEACEEVRKISHDMASGVLQKFGLITALNNLRDSVNETGQLRMTLLTFGMEDERLDYRKEINLYRIIQELLSNTLKHAKASEMTIQLLRKENNLNVLVEDDGRGFDPNLQDAEGMGLKNVQTRVTSLDGKMAIDSGKGSGTTVSIDIPIE